MTIKVKSLRWFEVARYRHGGKYTADGYTIRYIEGFFILDFASESKATWRLTTIEAAKAAAQADYEARILSAIEEVDPAAIRAEALREVLDDMWNLINAIDDEDFHGMVPGRPATIIGHYEEYHRRHIEHAQQIAESLTALIDKEQDHGR